MSALEDRLGIVPPDIRARYERQEFVERGVNAGRALARYLKEHYGPEMDVVFVRHDARPDDIPESCVPGRWHVVKHIPPPALPRYLPILGPGGSYRDPDFGVVAELAETDLRRPGVMERMMERNRTDAPHKRRERELKTEQRRDELKHNFEAAKRVRGEGGLKKSFEAKRRSVK